MAGSILKVAIIQLHTGTGKRLTKRTHASDQCVDDHLNRFELISIVKTVGSTHQGCIYFYVYPVSVWLPILYFFLANGPSPPITMRLFANPTAWTVSSRTIALQISELFAAPHSTKPIEKISIEFGDVTKILDDRRFHWTHWKLLALGYEPRHQHTIWYAKQ